jgi:predicted DsbA family dithiol-disulfide isomerase
MSAATPTLDVEVWFDLVCPWCLIGKRHLATALEHLRQAQPQIECTIRWRSVQLLPDVPLAGLPYRQFYLDRLGSADAVAARQREVQAAASGAGLEIRFDHQQVMPNTLAAHRLIAVAASKGLDVAGLVDALLAAYFSDGLDIGDSAVLMRVALEAGLDAEASAACLHADPGTWQPPPLPVGAHGVPHFVFNGRLALSGAQMPATLLEAARSALAHSTDTLAERRKATARN